MMFERLRSYDRVLVTGPQRSGTTIAARMISQDTGYNYIGEESFSVHDEGAFRELAKADRAVIQCPSMCHIVHEVASPSTLVVMMIRDCDDIYASEQRVDWSVGVYPELYTFGLSPRRAKSFRRHGGRVAPLKYARWRTEQRLIIPHWLELPYESLSGHPLWIPKEQRASFSTRQTTGESPHR